MEKPWSSVKYAPSFIRTSDTGLFTYKTPSTTVSQVEKPQVHQSHVEYTNTVLEILYDGGFKIHSLSKITL